MLLGSLQDRGTATINRKRHWLVEQKLLHFVDAFHQYVMDRVIFIPTCTIFFFLTVARAFFIFYFFLGGGGGVILGFLFLILKSSVLEIHNVTLQKLEIVNTLYNILQ